MINQIIFYKIKKIWLCIWKAWSFVLNRAGGGLEDDIREGGMSVFGGDSWAREAQHRKRKVEDLMVEGLDASSYKKLSTGNFACLLCPNNPILDSPLMLSVCFIIPLLLLSIFSTNPTTQFCKFYFVFGLGQKIKILLENCRRLDFGIGVFNWV